MREGEQRDVEYTLEKNILDGRVGLNCGSWVSEPIDYESKSTVCTTARRIAELETKMARKHEVLSELMDDLIALIRNCAALTGGWVALVTHDTVIDFLRV